MSEREKPDFVNIVQSRPSDAELAKQFREELRALLEPVAEAINRARIQGLKIEFNVGPDAFGRVIVQPIYVSRLL